MRFNTEYSASMRIQLTSGVSGRVPSLVITMDRDVETKVFRQIMVVTVPEHIGVVACQDRWLVGSDFDV